MRSRFALPAIALVGVSLYLLLSSESATASKPAASIESSPTLLSQQLSCSPRWQMLTGGDTCGGELLAVVGVACLLAGIALAVLSLRRSSEATDP